MSREIVLIDYLPPFLQGYREIQAIMTAENPEFQAVSDEGQVVLDNTFIMYCSEKGIARFEKMLGIYPLPTDTLDSRRSRVLTRWNEQLPYTMRTLKQQLEALCGKDGYSIELYNDAYTIEVKVNLIAKSNFDDVDALLQRVIPANMIIDLRLIYNQHLTLKQFTHAHLQTYTHNQLRSEVLE